MEVVLRTLATYGFLLVVFRVMGKRSLAQVTTFDFVLLLVIGEATQQGLVGEDYSVTNAVVVIATLAVVELATGWASQRSPAVDRLINGVPLVIVEDGAPLQDRMARAGVDVDDVLEAARTDHGIAHMDQVRFAVLERDGDISIIPRAPA